ncbi:RNA polymerase sigma factor [Longispora fulva]|uniref:DNA-directed RNA polymerase specialized sigma24 family protein n=1 Tax=Longispora fulva TaxID=619741 RepID=A0A8J7KIU2_9ACTN|nr:hypothetical protein [Longispora fulva]MBG6134721.1 DNA-directed RNA polymerase specialized sigma24 family protein [Longispora fulva]
MRPALEALAARAGLVGDGPVQRDREAACVELVALVRAGGPDAADAFGAVCASQTNRLHAYFQAKGVPPHDAEDLTADLLLRVLRAHANRALTLEHGYRSFFEYVFTSADHDAARYARRRTAAVPTDPALLPERGSTPDLAALDGSQELVDWLAQATSDRPRDLVFIRLASSGALSRAEIAATVDVRPHRYSNALHAAVRRVHGRFLDLYLARCRGVPSADRPCAGLVRALSDRFDVTDPAGFAPVRGLVRAHRATCAECTAFDSRVRARGVTREFLAVPLVAASVALLDRVRAQQVTLTGIATPAPGAAEPPTGADRTSPSTSAEVSLQVELSAPVPADVPVPPDVPVADPVGPSGGGPSVAGPGGGWRRWLAVGGAGGAAVSTAIVILTLLPPPDGDHPSADPTPPGPSRPPATAPPGRSTGPTPGTGPGGDPSGSAGATPGPGDPGPPVSTAAPRWAMAYMDRASTSEAPIGSEVPLGAGTQWRTSQSATSTRPVTVLHTGTGAYTVRLPDLADDGGVAHTTAYRTEYRGRSCLVRGYRAAGPDELVDVRCFDQNGAAVDWWFTVFFGAPSAGQAPQATIRYDGGTATGYNSAGGRNEVVRDGPGRYRAVLPGAPFAADHGFTDVTAWATDAAVRCQPQGGRPVGGALEVTVACYRIGASASPQPVDAPWLLTHVAGSGLQHQEPAAYLASAGDPANPVINSGHSYVSDGGTPSLTRVGLGQYQVTYPSLGRAGGTAQVTATGPDGGYCLLVTVNASSAPQLHVVVHCYTPAGVPGDTRFAFAYLRAP